MDIIKTFENNNAGMHITIRGTHEEPLFRASDIAAIFEITNIRQNISDFNSSEKVVCLTYTPGGEQEVTFLTEFGLYEIMFRSRKPIAKQFKNWVCEVIKEIRLNGKYQLEKQIEDMAIKSEENLLTNSSGKKLVYLGIVETIIENGITYTIVKFGQSKGIENRVLNGHKKDFPNFVLKYTIHSEFHIELEEAIKEAFKDKKSPLYQRRYKKVYTGRKEAQTELIKLDSSFTIEQLYMEVKKLNEYIICKKSFGDIKEENEKLIIENEKLKIENNTLKKELKNVLSITQTNIDIPTQITSDKKYFLLFYEDFIKFEQEGAIVYITHEELYNKYSNFIENESVQQYKMTYQKFGISSLKCPNITCIRMTLDKNHIDYIIGKDNRVKGKKIIIDQNMRKWLSDEYYSEETTEEKTEETTEETTQRKITIDCNKYYIKKLLLFLMDVVNNSKESIPILHNKTLYDMYRKNGENDLSLTQFGLYTLKIPGISKIKGSDGIWAKKINCQVVKEWIIKQMLE